MIDYDQEIKEYMTFAFSDNVTDKQNVITDFKEEVDINMLLDKYNDYKNLYEMFGDDEYLNEVEKVMIEMKGLL